MKKLQKNTLLKLGLFLLLFTIGAVACKNESDEVFRPQKGDILFQDLDCGPFCESIETVTPGYKGAELSHCGIVLEEEGQLKVIEAGGKGVVITPLDSFLTRARDRKSKPKVLVGRLKNWNASQLNEAINNAKQYLGKSYDAVFDLENDSLYCSELVYYSFLENDKPIFSTQPMTFKAPNTDSTFVMWSDYFRDMSEEIPEGKQGLNPGSISLSERVEIVYAYGVPEHYKPE